MGTTTLTLALLGLMAAASFGYALRCFHLAYADACQRARHYERLWQDAQHRLGEVRAERDEALDFADDAALMLGIASGTADDAKGRHPASRLTVVQ